MLLEGPYGSESISLARNPDILMVMGGVCITAAVSPLAYMRFLKLHILFA